VRSYIATPKPWDPLLRLRWKLWMQWQHLNESERAAVGILLGILLLLGVCWLWLQLRQRRSRPSGAA
jgi:hypothetical protein